MINNFTLMAVRTLVVIVFCRMFNCNSPPTNQCTQTCNEEKCGLKCVHGTPCMDIFNNVQPVSAQNNDGIKCVQTCKNGICSLECNKERCQQTCNNENGNCTLSCKGDRRCDQTCNKGNCSLKCNNSEHCQQECDNENGNCTLNCNGDRRCDQTCNKGNCSLECKNREQCGQECNNNNGTCTLKCYGERCNQTCQGGNCSLECHGNQCKQTCKSGKCTLKCHGDICEQKCNRVCDILECHRKTGTQDCSEVQGSCQLKCPVFSGGKVCQQNCQDNDRLCTKNVIATTTKASTTSSQLNHFSTAALSKSSSSTSTPSVAPSLTVSTALQSSSSSQASLSTRSSSMAGMSVTTTEIPLVTVAKDATDKSQNISRTEELVKNVISAFNRTDPKQETSLQDAVNLLQNTTEQLRNISHLRPEQKREGSIVKVVAAFEDFSLKYGRYHLNESMPQLSIKNNKLILHIQRFFHRDAGDFILKGTEKHNFMNISSRNFLNNDSLLVGVLYKDLHELLQSNPSNDDAPTNNKRIDTIIMAATMDPKPEKLQQNITFKFRNLKFADGKRYCVFWSDYSKENADGWSEEGCHVVRSRSSSEQTECSCNHMTHFAVLFNYGDNLEITTTDKRALRILTYVGLTLSIFRIILTILFYAYFTDVHQPLSQIRISLASSLGVGQVIFLAGINATEDKGTCVAVAALMQYFFMAAFCWMLVEGIYLYLFVVKVYNINNKMKMYYVMSWGLPAVMVTISLSIAAGRDGVQSFVSEEHCWMSSDNNLIWIFVAFVVMIEAVNILILVRVIKEMTTMQSTGENHAQQIRLGIKACAVLIPLLGVTWLFGLLSSLHKAFVYIFTILNSAQEFLIFLLHCLRNSQVKERFRRRMNTVFPISSANKVNSTKKTSQFNQSDIGISKEMELHSCRNSI